MTICTSLRNCAILLQLEKRESTGRSRRSSAEFSGEFSGSECPDGSQTCKFTVDYVAFGTYQIFLIVYSYGVQIGGVVQPEKYIGLLKDINEIWLFYFPTMLIIRKENHLLEACVFFHVYLPIARIHQLHLEKNRALFHFFDDGNLTTKKLS